MVGWDLTFHVISISQGADPGKLQDTASHPAKTEAPNLEGVEEEEEVELGDDGLLRLQEEVDELQENFDKAVIDKHSLSQTCQDLAEKLKSANHLLERLFSVTLLIPRANGFNL